MYNYLKRSYETIPEIGTHNVVFWGFHRGHHYWPAQILRKVIQSFPTLFFLSSAPFNFRICTNMPCCLHIIFIHYIHLYDHSCFFGEYNRSIYLMDLHIACNIDPPLFLYLILYFFVSY